MDVTVQRTAMFFGAPVLALYFKRGASFGFMVTRCLEKIDGCKNASETKKVEQSWRIAFSDQKDKPIRCRASMTCDGRRANQKRNTTLRRYIPSLSGGTYLVFCKIVSSRIFRAIVSSDRWRIAR